MFCSKTKNFQRKIFHFRLVSNRRSQWQSVGWRNRNLKESNLLAAETLVLHTSQRVYSSKIVQLPSYTKRESFQVTIPIQAAGIILNNKLYTDSSQLS